MSAIRCRSAQARLRQIEHAPDNDPAYQKYAFPPNCVTREQAVNRWSLGWVIAQAVAGILARRVGVTLGGLKIKDLVNEGRR